MPRAPPPAPWASRPRGNQGDSAATARRTVAVTPRHRCRAAAPIRRPRSGSPTHLTRHGPPAGGVRGGRSPLRFHIARPCPAAITHGGSFPARSASRRRVTLSWRPLVSEPERLALPQTKTGPSWARSTSCRAGRLRRERRAAPTGRLRLRVHEREAARQSLLDVIERDSGQVEIALGVHHDLHAVDLELAVVGPLLGVEFQRVRHTRAAAATHSHPQKNVLGQVLRLLELLHLLGRRFRQFDRHRSSPPYFAATVSAACLPL